MAIYGSRSSIGDQIIQKPKYEYSHEILHSNKEPDHIFCDRLNELESITVRSGYHHYPINGRHNVLVIRFNSSGSDLPGLSMKFTLNYRFKKGMSYLFFP
ncbi:unnamed protein product [Trichobilharzia regenti]|nr:unnamed protein product [Trichobilharzia regenti]